ncbi:glycerophosphodiester phosphodiesterase [Ruegeria sp. 2012CJ41-6]|uniref:Glycerophosphodiester phosphodiesterase n=1 Tax=Ruegeria spongiae TaxID=2942209 RepID=A0ABT0PZ24_9RHOB|nr:glycerophosphodiester phosphodiesterase [Ruegeria spongiae]MCL6282840.1 glycerophosphodiester phosphodiesterase [Ruegeria spongiae]
MAHLTAVVRAYRDAWARRRIFVPLYVVLRLLTVALIAPGVALAINLAVSLSHQSALTDQDIAFFLLSPVGFIVGVVVLSIVLVAEILGFAVMAACLRVETGNLWQAGSVALRLVLGKLTRLLEFALRLVLQVLRLVVPFAAIAGFIAWWALTEYDINYYLTFKPPSFLIAVGLIGLLVLAMVWVLIRRLSGWALALHMVLFEDLRPKASFAVSVSLMQGKQTALKLRLALWLIARAAIAALIAAVAGAALGLMPVPDGGGLTLVLRLSMAVVVLWAVLGLVLAATALGALAVLLDGYLDHPVHLKPHQGSAGLRGRLIAATCLSVLAVIAGGWVGNTVLARVQDDKPVAVIAHRGAAGQRPENTMASVQKAIEDQADWVEIDVQETADGVVVVMHDSDYMKLSGVDLKIWDATMGDLDGIDIGSWFDPAYGEERTPTLRDVLAAARGKSNVLIELKYYGHDVDLENRVIAIVEELGMQDQIATMSLKYQAVQKMRELRPDWRTGVLAATAIGDMAGLEGNFVAVSTTMARPGLIRSVQEAGKDFYVWTVNDPLEMSKMISLGTDGLITDEPALAKEVIRIRQELGPSERVLLWFVEEMGVDLTQGSYRDNSP